MGQPQQLLPVCFNVKLVFAWKDTILALVILSIEFLSSCSLLIKQIALDETFQVICLSTRLIARTPLTLQLNLETFGE